MVVPRESGEVEGHMCVCDIEGLPPPGRRRKLHGQRVDPLPPPWGSMVNYASRPSPCPPLGG